VGAIFSKTSGEVCTSSCAWKDRGHIQFLISSKKGQFVKKKIKKIKEKKNMTKTKISVNAIRYPQWIKIRYSSVKMRTKKGKKEG
jgi:hypothetical protein